MIVELPAAAPAICRKGLGYQGVFSGGWVLNLTHVSNSRGEVHGMLDASGTQTGSLYKGRFNVSSLTARSSTAKYLQLQSGYDGFREILEQFCRHVLRLQEEGPVTEFIGQAPKRARIPYLLDPILPEGVPTIIYGPAEAGKSSLAVAIAFTVQTGIPILGWTPRKANVMILDWESQRASWDDRMAGYANGLNEATPRIRYERHFTRFADSVERLSGVVQENDIGLLIIDSATPAEGGRSEGTSAEEATLRFYAGVRAIGITTLVIDQLSKESQAAKTVTSPYGSGFKMYEARQVWELRAEAAPEHVEEHQILLTHHKASDDKKSRPIGLKLAFGNECHYIENCEISAPDLAPRARSLSDRMRELLRSGSMPVTEVGEALDSSTNAVRQAMFRHKDLFVRLDDHRIGLAAVI